MDTSELAGQGLQRLTAEQTRHRRQLAPGGKASLRLDAARGGVGASVRGGIRCPFRGSMLRISSMGLISGCGRIYCTRLSHRTVPHPNGKPWSCRLPIEPLARVRFAADNSDNLPSPPLSPKTPILVPAASIGVTSFCSLTAAAESPSTNGSPPALPLSETDIYVDMDTDNQEKITVPRDNNHPRQRHRWSGHRSARDRVGLISPGMQGPAGADAETLGGVSTA